MTGGADAREAGPDDQYIDVLRGHAVKNLHQCNLVRRDRVTRKHDLWLKPRGRGGVISGRMRLQYQFMISKFPIGTFSIYSCLGGATFKAKIRS